MTELYSIPANDFLCIFELIQLVNVTWLRLYTCIMLTNQGLVLVGIFGCYYSTSSNIFLAFLLSGYYSHAILGTSQRILLRNAFKKLLKLNHGKIAEPFLNHVWLNPKNYVLKNTNCFADDSLSRGKQRKWGAKQDLTHNSSTALTPLLWDVATLAEPKPDCWIKTTISTKSRMQLLW